MIEEEWLKATDPTLMLRFLRDKASDRKLRLFICGCSRRVWHLFKDEECKAVIELGEKLADGLVSNEERRAKSLQENQHLFYGSPAAWMALGKPAAHSSEAGSDHAARMMASSLTSLPKRLRDRVNPRYEAEFFQSMNIERAAQTSLLRDIFGNPFRPVTLNPSWLTSTVIALAEGIYQDRAFDRMPILADALQNAGCDNEEMLNHCRQPGKHTRGCWAVDQLLGKK